MTNNTIPNVPRELLERARAAVASTNTSNWSSDLLRDIHAILSAPSPAGVDDDYVPEGLVQAVMQSEEVDAVALAAKSLKAAGVDGLEVVATLLIDDPTDQECGDWDIEVESKVAERMSEHGGGQHELCRLSDAQAIIDGLRGEVATLTAESELGLSHYVNMQQERDQHAKRIGELEGLLYEASGELRTDRQHGLRPRIDAALSAGKEGK